MGRSDERPLTQSEGLYALHHSPVCLLRVFALWRSDDLGGDKEVLSFGPGLPDGFPDLLPRERGGETEASGGWMADAPFGSITHDGRGG